MLKIYAESDLKKLREAHRRAGPVDRMMEKEEQLNTSQTRLPGM
jgi:hypothetical protein